MKISVTGELFLIRANHGWFFFFVMFCIRFMRLFQSDRPLAWGELDLPVLGMTSDWHGRALNPPLGFVLVTDTKSLWFVATRQSPATCRPGVAPGAFTEGLWEWDVAELFLADPTRGNYLEFNLAPNGAWWAAKLISPRVRAQTQPDFQSAVTSYWEKISDNGWCAAIQVPIDFLKSEIGFGSQTTANATAILNSPKQSFHSVAKLPGAEPDFHQPASFLRLVPGLCD